MLPLLVALLLLISGAGIAYGQQIVSDDVVTVNATVPVKLRFAPALVPVTGQAGQQQTPIIQQPLLQSGVQNPAPTPTAPSNIPAITVGGTDITGILTGIIASLGGIGGISGYLFKRRKTVETRANIAAETQIETAESIRETDYGVRELAQTVAKLAENPNDENVKKRAKELAAQWDKDVRKYYEAEEPIECQFSDDKVVKKLAVAKKQLIPSKLPEE